MYFGDLLEEINLNYLGTQVCNSHINHIDDGLIQPDIKYFPEYSIQ